MVSKGLIGNWQPLNTTAVTDITVTDMTVTDITVTDITVTVISVTAVVFSGYQLPINPFETIFLPKA